MTTATGKIAQKQENLTFTHSRKIQNRCFFYFVFPSYFLYIEILLINSWFKRLHLVKGVGTKSLGKGRVNNFAMAQSIQMKNFINFYFTPLGVNLHVVAILFVFGASIETFCHKYAWEWKVKKLAYFA